MYIIQQKVDSLKSSIDRLSAKIKEKLDLQDVEYSPDADLITLIRLIPYKITKPIDLYSPLKSHTLLKYDNKIYVVGGLDNSNNALNTHKVYDYITNTFTIKTNYPQNIAYHSCVVWSNYIMYSGGTNSSNSLAPISSVYTYNVGSDFFTAKNNLPITLLAHNMVGTDNKIIVSGGYSTLNNTPTSKQYDYTRVADSYREVTNLKSSTDFFASQHISNDQILHTGGNQPASNTSNYIYDAGSNSITDKTNLTQARGKHKATLTSSNEVLLIGGVSQNKNDVMSSFNINSNSFTSKKTAPVTINSHAVIQLDNNLVLLSGGEQDGSITARQIVYETDRDRYVYNN